MSENVGVTTPRERHRNTMRELRDFREIAGALGADPDAAVARASDLGDDRRDLDNAEVFILVLREIVDQR